VRPEPGDERHQGTAGQYPPCCVRAIGGGLARGQSYGFSRGTGELNVRLARNSSSFSVQPVALIGLSGVESYDFHHTVHLAEGIGFSEKVVRIGLPAPIDDKTVAILAGSQGNKSTEGVLADGIIGHADGIPVIEVTSDSDIVSIGKVGNEE